MKLGPEYPELLTDLALQLRQSLINRGRTAEEADEIARHATEHVRRHWGGQIVYIPKGDRYEAKAQWREIWAKFTGNNVPQLAAEYDLTEIHVYYIIRQMRAEEQARLQPSLFESK